MDTQNTPCSIKPPANWEQVAAYSRNGQKPAPELARKAFDELLVNIRLENCVFFPEVVNAMLRQAPARIEAENFGHHGLGKSYQVNDAKHLSAFYRQSEPVPITSQTGIRRQSSQYITLKAGEWTAYTIDSRAPKNYDISMRAKAAGAPAQIQLSIGGQLRMVVLSQNEWSAVKIGTLALGAGQNQLKLQVKTGAADIDWLEVKHAKGIPESAALKPVPPPH
jgi:hypothetical protein